LSGGFPGWVSADLPVAALDPAAGKDLPWHDFDFRSVERVPGMSDDDSFVPLLVGRHVAVGQELPIRREMAVLFVDMVESTPLLWRHPTEQVLALVQAFMEVVVEVAVHHCGDVHDFQGDGALLYFDGPGEAVPAAFRLRDALAERRRRVPDLPEARIALDSGPVVIGLVGTAIRRSLTFVGPSINVAARILKLAPPEGIIATDAIVTHARRADPDLARRFRPLDEQPALKGIGDAARTIFIA
jgi:class 3 adenylate cyclase